MKYEVNRFSKGGFFMVPAEVADRFLKLATHDQLKVMLKVCSLGAPEFDTEDIAKELRISDEQAKEAVDFWASAGFFISRNAPVKEPKPEAHPAKKAVRAATVKPDRNEVARRGTEEPQIAFLLGEAQKKLGRALKQSESSTIVWLFDDEGINTPLMLMLFEHEAANGMFRIGAIERTAMEWIDAGVEDVKQAEEFLARRVIEKNAWTRVERVFGIANRKPSKKEAEFAVRWTEEMGFSDEMLKEAYDVCIDSTAKLSMPYINKILENWRSEGITDVTGLKAKQKTDAAPKPSAYDFDESMMYDN